ncbi:MAG: hypothetical protein ACREL5_13100 [Gemmatimonadales bacterium]
MSITFRRILAVMAACGAAFLIVYLLNELAAQVTMPPGINATNAGDVKRALERGEFPFASLALILCGWLVAAYAGSRVASRLGRARWTVLAFTVLLTVGVIVRLSELPHPLWMWIGGAVGAPLVALGAAGETISVPTL